MAGLAAKRALDLVGSAVGLVVLSPVLAAAAVAVRVCLGAPVIFAQRRPGRQGRPFTIYKFRTMSDERDAAGELLGDEIRLGRLGRFLRSTSLDELPELYNVLRGDMSLVGPRPLLDRYLPLYSADQARRHEVRPGITGWSQVNGRNASSWAEKLSQDVWYVDHRTMRLDLRILVATVAAVVRRQGISADGHATMPLFEGTYEPPVETSIEDLEDR